MKMQTYSGREFELEHIREEDIVIRDIAHSLAMTCRFGGHSKYFYSVAQHSIRVCAIAPGYAKLEALMHDAAEAYVGDIIRPLKAAFPVLVEQEKKVFALIASKFSLDCSLRIEAIVKNCDDYVLRLETQELQKYPFASTSDTPVRVPVPKVEVASMLFMRLFHTYHAKKVSPCT